MTKSVPDILREHALYHKNACLGPIEDNKAFRATQDAYGGETHSLQWDEDIRRMFLLFVAESLENPC